MRLTSQRAAARVTLLMGGLLLFAAPLRAGVPEIKLERVEVSQPPTVRFFFTLFDEDGRAVAPDSAPRFFVVVNAADEEGPFSAQASSASEPLASVVLFPLTDATSSYTEHFKAAVEKLVRSFPSASKVLVMGYDDGPVGVDLGFVDPNRALASLATMSVKEHGDVDLPGAIADGLSRLRANGLPARKMLVVLSDGFSSLVEMDNYRELGEQALAQEIKIYSIAALTELSRINVAYAQSLSELSRRTGSFRKVDAGPKLQDAALALAEELSRQQVLEAALPQHFRGKPVDFALKAEGIAKPSELKLVILPEFRQQTLLPMVLLGAALVLAGLSVFLLVRRHKLRSGEAARTLEALRQTPLIAGSDDEEDDDHLGRTQLLEGAPANRTPAQTSPFGGAQDEDAPTIQLESVQAPQAPVLDQHLPQVFDAPDTLAPEALRPPRAAQLARPAQGGAPPPGQLPAAGAGAILPNPTEFLRRVRGQEGSEEDHSARLKAPIPAYETGQESKKVWEGWVRGPTMLMPLEDLAGRDTTAWLVPLNGSYETIPLKAGLKIGADSGDIKVAPVKGQPKTGRFEQNAQGRWRLRLDDHEARVLSERDRFFVGDTEFVFLEAGPVPEHIPGPILVVEGGPDDGRRIALAANTTLSIGSDPSCHIVVRGDGVAARHVAVRVEGARCQIADLGSEAGLRGGDDRPLGVASLKDRDEVRIGVVRLIYRRTETGDGRAEA